MYQTKYKISKDFNQSMISPIQQESQPLQSKNLSDPKVWGPPFWFVLHNGSINYPNNASNICSERMKNFIIGMPTMIPCEKCKDHATAYIEQNWNNLDNIVSCRKNLFEFFVDFHNYVNRRYGKPELTYADVYTLYNS